MWLGPFILAYVAAEDAFDGQHLTRELGPLARFLLPARTLDIHAVTDWLLTLDAPGHLALQVDALELRAPLHALLREANARLYGEQALDESSLRSQWRHDFISYWERPEPGCATDRSSVVELGHHQSVQQLHAPTLDELASAVYVGPAELLRDPLPFTSRRASYAMAA